MRLFLVGLLIELSTFAVSNKASAQSWPSFEADCSTDTDQGLRDTYFVEVHYPDSRNVREVRIYTLEGDGVQFVQFVPDATLSEDDDNLHYVATYEGRTVFDLEVSKGPEHCGTRIPSNPGALESAVLFNGHPLAVHCNVCRRS